MFYIPKKKNVWNWTRCMLCWEQEICCKNRHSGGVFSSWGAYILFMNVNQIYRTEKENVHQSVYCVYENNIPQDLFTLFCTLWSPEVSKSKANLCISFVFGTNHRWVQLAPFDEPVSVPFWQWSSFLWIEVHAISSSC